MWPLFTALVGLGHDHCYYGEGWSRLAERADEKVLFNTTKFTVTHPGYTVSRLIMNFIQYVSLFVELNRGELLIPFEIR